jgi:hypothetical protein
LHSSSDVREAVSGTKPIGAKRLFFRMVLWRTGISVDFIFEQESRVKNFENCDISYPVDYMN